MKGENAFFETKVPAVGEKRCVFMALNVPYCFFTDIFQFSFLIYSLKWCIFSVEYS